MRPGELTTAVGERAKELARTGRAPRAFVFGLTSDHFAYCGDSEECAQGTYEGRVTLFGSDESARILESIDTALTAVGFKPPDVPR